MKKLLLSALFFAGNMTAYVKPTYNECAAIGFLTMMCMCRLSDQKYITNETLNKIFTDKNLLIMGTALGISVAINTYKNYIKNNESEVDKTDDIITTTEEIEKAEMQQS
jgi:hypothetical protein